MTNPREAPNAAHGGVDPAADSQHRRTDRAAIDAFEMDAIRWTVRDEWSIELPRKLPPPRLELTADEQRFWPTYRWSNNPWILMQAGC